MYKHTSIQPIENLLANDKLAFSCSFSCPSYTVLPLVPFTIKKSTLPISKNIGYPKIIIKISPTQNILNSYYFNFGQNYPVLTNTKIRTFMTFYIVTLTFEVCIY